MDVREHQDFGHGLRPGTDRDINCSSCIREDAMPFHVGDAVEVSLSDAGWLSATVTSATGKEVVVRTARGTTNLVYLYGGKSDRLRKV